MRTVIFAPSLPRNLTINALVFLLLLKIYCVIQHHGGLAIPIYAKSYVQDAALLLTNFLFLGRRRRDESTPGAAARRLTFLLTATFLATTAATYTFAAGENQAICAGQKSTRVRIRNFN
ncbi:MAG: hypothetical protein HYV63_22650 [Candidatus Schekmanbacteria bacterium]|nr:hypothetical protein [Candidatus Schekmanbacteria bacterium]